MSGTQPTTRARPGVIAARAPVAVLLLLVAVVIAGCGSNTVTVDARPPAAADRAVCRSLLNRLPTHVADQARRTVEPDGAWGAAWGDPPIVLTCGAAAPRGYGRASSCTTVNGVDWYLPEAQLQPGGSPSDVTMTTVHRTVNVEVRMPADYWPPAATLADLSSAISAALPRAGHCL